MQRSVPILALLALCWSPGAPKTLFYVPRVQLEQAECHGRPAPQALLVGNGVYGQLHVQRLQHLQGCVPGPHVQLCNSNVPWLSGCLLTSSFVFLVAMASNLIAMAST